MWHLTEREPVHKLLNFGVAARHGGGGKHLDGVLAGFQTAAIPENSAQEERVTAQENAEARRQEAVPIHRHLPLQCFQGLRVLLQERLDAPVRALCLGGPGIIEVVHVFPGRIEHGKLDGDLPSALLHETTEQLFQKWPLVVQGHPQAPDGSGP